MSDWIFPALAGFVVATMTWAVVVIAGLCFVEWKWRGFFTAMIRREEASRREKEPLLGVATPEDCRDRQLPTGA